MSSKAIVKTTKQKNYVLQQKHRGRGEGGLHEVILNESVYIPTRVSSISMADILHLCLLNS